MKRDGIDAVCLLTEQALQAIVDLVEKDSKDLATIACLTEMATLGCSEMTTQFFEPPSGSLVAQALKAGGAHEWLEIQAYQAAKSRGLVQ